MGKETSPESLVAKIVLDDTRYVETLYVGKNGEKISKHISFDAYVNALNSFRESELTIMPRLPEKALDLRFGSKEDFVLTFFLEAQVLDSSYLKVENLVKLPYPNLVFFIKVNRGRHIDSRVFAVKECRAQVNESTRLYNFPYGNVYHNTGKICWGSTDITHRSYKEVGEAGRILPTFFQAVMNDDLYRSGSTVTSKVELCEFIEKQQKKTKFDNRILTPAGTLTYGGVLSNI